jgi:hypothetical protein
VYIAIKTKVSKINEQQTFFLLIRSTLGKAITMEADRQKFPFSLYMTEFGKELSKS